MICKICKKEFNAANHIKKMHNITSKEYYDLYIKLENEGKCKIYGKSTTFNEKGHLQNHKQAEVTYGLFYNNQLVQLMSFSRNKYNRNLKSDTEWSIERGCPGSNNIVVGGVEKLFKHFIRDYKPTKIFSYCDFNKFDGRSYEAIGMVFDGYTGPDKYWIKDGQMIRRSPNKYKYYKENADGILYGSGSKKYVWTKEVI